MSPKLERIRFSITLSIGINLKFFRHWLQRKSSFNRESADDNLSHNTPTYCARLFSVWHTRKRFLKAGTDRWYDKCFLVISNTRNMLCASIKTYTRLSFNKNIRKIRGRSSIRLSTLPIGHGSLACLSRRLKQAD